ncbi:MAG: NADH-quinone oxidoreductase subunit NuoE [Pseudomonadota bacterium]
MSTPAADLNKLSPILSGGHTEADLIPTLQKVQEEYGYVPPEALPLIGQALRIPASRVQGVINFYSMFYTEPRGRNVVTVCRGTACHVRGGRGVLRVVQKIMGLKEGQTSEDFHFTLETVACLGACALSPVMVVNGQIFGRMNPKRIETILAGYQRERDD